MTDTNDLDDVAQETGSGLLEGKDDSSSGYTPPQPIDPPQAPVPADGRDALARGVVASFCGSGMMLLIAICMSVYLVVKIVAAMNWLSFVISIPVIIICIGTWVVYVGGLRHDLGTPGLSLMNGGMMANEVLWIVLASLMALVGLLVMVSSGAVADAFAGTMVFGLGLGFLVMGIVYVIFLALFWNKLRKTVTSARSILQGEGSEWTTSTFVIVILCILILFGLFSIISSLMMRGAGTSISYDLTDGTLSSLTALGANMHGTTALTIVGDLLYILMVMLGIIAMVMIRKRADKLARTAQPAAGPDGPHDVTSAGL